MSLEKFARESTSLGKLCAETIGEEKLGQLLEKGILPTDCEKYLPQHPMITVHNSHEAIVITYSKGKYDVFVKGEHLFFNKASACSAYLTMYTADPRNRCHEWSLHMTKKPWRFVRGFPGKGPEAVELWKKSWEEAFAENNANGYILRNSELCGEYDEEDENSFPKFTWREPLLPYFELQAEITF